MRLFLYTDGGSRGNPGPSAIGGVCYDVTGIEDYFERSTVQHDRELFTFSHRLGGLHTNNEAEYLALIEGLRMVTAKYAGTVHCWLDSDLVVKQMTNKWKVSHPHIQELVNRARALARADCIDRITFNWIRRNYNQVADRLVNEALDAENNH